MINDELKSTSTEDSHDKSITPTHKRKRQRTDDIFSEYTSSAAETYGKKQTYGSEEDNNENNEILNYKTLMLKEKGSKQDENPLLWWKSNETMFPMLSLLASMFNLALNRLNSSYFVGRVFSIPVTSASVERQFSQAGLVYCDRRTRTKPTLLNDMLLVRSKYKIGLNDV